MFSIVIPTWNNLAFARLCVESIRKNSAYSHQVILHINDGSDGTRAWAEKEGLDFTHTVDNAGICIAVNSAAGLATKDYIVYMNDDMYVCPGWDRVIALEIEKLSTDNFLFSATMIEPQDTGNPCVLVGDYGRDIASFREADLLQEFSGFIKNDWSGSAWPPTIVSKKYWQITGGYSIELSPGMSSDDDFAMKMWYAGCRVFKGIGNSRVYHFQAKSTLRIKKNDGRRQFLMKWGMNQSTFNRHFIRRGCPFTERLPEPPNLKWERFRAKFKQRFL
ncbi:MAG TPA: glycosyltransferase family A protein [Edaphocola sp.]|nr:glycosyltransferase family A protein [Edaphocola sp.]